MNTRIPRNLTASRDRSALFYRREDGAVSLRIPTNAVAKNTLGRTNNHGVSLDLFSDGSEETVLKRNEDGSTSINLD